MKNIFRLFFLLTSIAINAQNSVPDYFAANSRWVETILYNSEDTNPEYVQYYIDGDSLLDGKHYYKLMLTKVPLRYGFGFDRRENNHLQGLLRQEGQKVYYRGFFLQALPYSGNTYVYDYSPLPEEEVLLFDYGMQLGDTLDVKNHPQFYEYLKKYPEDTLFVVDQIYDNTSVKLYPSYWMKYMYLESVLETDGFNRIEGICASSRFFLGQYYGRTDYRHWLECYANDSTALLEGHERDILANPEKCSFITTIQEKEVESKPILFPKPSKGMLYCSEAKSINAYVIFNALGKEVIKVENHVKASSIAINSLPNGVYMVHLTLQNGQQWVEKVVLEKE